MWVGLGEGGVESSLWRLVSAARSSPRPQNTLLGARFTVHFSNLVSREQCLPHERFPSTPGLISLHLCKLVVTPVYIGDNVMYPVV